MMITAHSGCDGNEPNSLAFLNYAFASSVDAVEVDVRFDGERLILSHDEIFSEPVTLEQAFSLLKLHPEKKINCDLKTSGLEASVYALASKMGVEKQLIFTGEVDKNLFKKDHRKYPEVLWYANISTVTNEACPGSDAVTSDEKKEYLLRVLQEIKKYDAAGLNWWYGDAELVWDEAKQLGIMISIWTVSDEADLDYFIKKCPDNITTRNTVYALKKFGE